MAEHPTIRRLRAIKDGIDKMVSLAKTKPMDASNPKYEMLKKVIGKSETINKIIDTLQTQYPSGNISDAAIQKLEPTLIEYEGILEIPSGSSKPKKCRKCGLYKL
jgi:hypothetical protein